MLIHRFWISVNWWKRLTRTINKLAARLLREERVPDQHPRMAWIYQRQLPNTLQLLWHDPPVPFMEDRWPSP